MAVIGARPATGIWVFRRRPRIRTRPAERGSSRRLGAQRRRRETTGVSSFLIGIAAAAGLALFYLSQSSHVAATGYQIDALQAQLDAVRAEQQQLVLQVGEARSPASILSRATGQLQLVPLPQGDVTFATPSTKPH